MKQKTKRETDKTAQNWPPGLSLKQIRAINAVFEMSTVSAALKKAGVSRSIYYTWIRQDQTFRTELHARQREIHESSLHDLKALSGEAVAELQRLLAAKDPRVRMAAVKTILDAGMRANEQLDFIDRLEALENGTNTNVIS